NRTGNVMSSDGADEILSLPGPRDRADAVLRIRSGANQRRVPNATRVFVSRSSGRSGGSEVNHRIQSNRAHHALRSGHDIATPFPALLAAELRKTLIGTEIMIGNRRYTVLQREFFRT